jgi:hypothetical protein
MNKKTLDSKVFPQTQGEYIMNEEVKPFTITHSDLLKTLKNKFIDMAQDLEKHLCEYAQNMGFDLDNEDLVFHFKKSEFEVGFQKGKLLFRKCNAEPVSLVDILKNDVNSCHQMLSLTKCTKAAIIPIKEQLQEANSNRQQAYKEAWDLIEELHENFDNITE